MSGFADLIRGGVALAHSLTSSLQIEVEHIPWDGTFDAQGKPNYVPRPGEMRTAVVTKSDKHVIDENGNRATSTRQLTFLSSVEVAVRDRFIVDEVTMKVLSVGGPADPGTGTYITEVFLG